MNLTNFFTVIIRSSRLSLHTRDITSSSSSSSASISAKQRQRQRQITVDFLVKHCGLSPQGADVASKRFKLRCPTLADSVLSFLRNHAGFSQTQISKVVRSHPSIIQQDPHNTILPKLNYFNSLGASTSDTATIVSSNPSILSRSLDTTIIPNYKALRSVLSQTDVVSVFKRNSWLVSTVAVGPNLKLLRESGVPESSIVLITRNTRLLISNPKELQRVVRRVKEMGFDVMKTVTIYALRALSTKNIESAMSRNRKLFMTKWGWSEEDVLSTFKCNPTAMTMSEDKLMRVMEFLVNKMGWSSTMAAKYRVVWCLSLDKRIIPRCSVVKILMSKGLMKEGKFSFSTVLCPVEKRFLELYVDRYHKLVPELRNVYKGKLAIKDVLLQC